jgi:hypothetical protein
MPAHNGVHPPPGDVGGFGGPKSLPPREHFPGPVLPIFPFAPVGNTEILSFSIPFQRQSLHLCNRYRRNKHWQKQVANSSAIGTGVINNNK